MTVPGVNPPPEHEAFADKCDHVSYAMSYGIVASGAYVPRLRLERSAIAAAHRWMSAGGGAPKGCRAYCSWDEDAVTMAVEAGRGCILPDRPQRIRSLVLASTTLPYADLMNASIVAGALALGDDIRLADATGSQRAGLSALIAALDGGVDDALLIASERPRAKPASQQELGYGAGAAAIRLGSSNVVARALGSASVFAPFVDHFRPSGGAYDLFWEERWIRDEGYAELAPRAALKALAAAGLSIGDIGHLVLPTPLRGGAELVARKLGFVGVVADALEGDCGFCGAAHALMMLALVLERAQPGQRILVLSFAQGVDALILETTDAIAAVRPTRSMTGALADKIVGADYLRMLSFYDEIGLEWGMRADRPGRAALSEQYRSADQLSSFMAGKCGRCGTLQFPQLAYCVNPSCGAPSSEFSAHSLVDEPARMVTVTADWLSYYPAPPLHVGFVQFEAGARLLMEVVGVGPEGLDVGAPLRIAFRIKERDKARGYNRYFWKATPNAATQGGP